MPFKLRKFESEIKNKQKCFKYAESEHPVTESHVSNSVEVAPVTPRKIKEEDSKSQIEIPEVSPNKTMNNLTTT